MSMTLKQFADSIEEGAMPACVAPTQSEFCLSQSAREAVGSLIDTRPTDAPSSVGFDTDDETLSAKLSEQDHEDEDMLSVAVPYNSYDECGRVEFDDCLSDGFSDDEDEACDVGLPMMQQKTWDRYEERNGEITSAVSCPAPVVIQPMVGMPQCMVVCCNFVSCNSMPIGVPFHVPTNISMTSLPAPMVSSTQSTPAAFPAIEKQSKISQGESVEHHRPTVPSRPPGSFNSTQKSESQTGARRKTRNTKSNTDARTTVMLRNLPSYSTREMLLDILNSLGFKVNVWILYDSEYAAGIIQRRYRARSNLALVLQARAAYDEVASRVVLEHIDAHTGHLLNERADRLAKCGAAGILRGGVVLFPGEGFPDD